MNVHDVLSSVSTGWKEAPVRDQPTKVKWLLVVELAEARVTLGLDEGGTWLRADAQGVTRLDRPESFIFFLPCLELSYGVLRAQLAASLGRLGLPEELVETFPFVALVRAGLERRSAHWSTLALKWLDSMPVVVSYQHSVVDSA